MPRIHDDYLDCVFNLYPSRKDAAEGSKLGGTGFFIKIVSDARSDRTYLYAISNKHVVQAAPVLRVNHKDGSAVALMPPGIGWVQHPELDIAVAHLGGLDEENIKFKGTGFHTLLTTEIIQQHNIGPGDDVFMVGRFISHESKTRNTPTARFGAISMMPLEPIPVENMPPQEAFLVEMHSIPGYSGSPTFVYAPPFSDRKDGSNCLSANPLGPWVLGINFCFLPLPSEAHNSGIFQFIVEPKMHSGFAGVVPAWHIRAMLMLPVFQKLRQDADRILLAREGGQ